ncbi:hypothetical protein ABZU75_25210 [Streptosporangium sp. NPDC005286]|uniref:hypothetical protein n=1 Tax=Streptosporangium sp. NPDC005286 TaxID=3154463 RepID=UPI0033A97444
MFLSDSAFVPTLFSLFPPVRGKGVPSRARRAGTYLAARAMPLIRVHAARPSFHLRRRIARRGIGPLVILGSHTVAGAYAVAVGG